MLCTVRVWPFTISQCDQLSQNTVLSDVLAENLMCIGPCTILLTGEQNPTRCHLLIYCAYVRLNMFRAPLCTSSGAHDDSVGYHIDRLVLELLLVGS